MKNDNTDVNQQVKAGRDMLTANLLAMLKGWSAYGYDLVQRLEDAGFGEYNKGTVYRALRHMEAMGLVSSAWDTSSGGPARRMYQLTKAGSMFLENWISVLDTHRTMLETFAKLTIPDSAPADTNKSADGRSPNSPEESA
ncbi:MAG: helix-turn-helix transcriptional regulator [Gammaproteobacteria bacterium]